MEGEGARVEPLTSRICDRGVALFALWTLLANAAVWLGAGLDELIAAAAAGTAGGLGWLAWRRRTRTARTAAAGPPSDPAEPGAPEPALPRRLVVAIALVALAVPAIHAGLGRLEACWWLGLPACAACLVASLRHPPRRQPAARGRALERWLVALALICALATAIAHREDADDAFYVNLVVAAVDQPRAPLLAQDTLHGYPGVPMSLPVFRVLSWELLQAAIVRLSGIPALTLVHVILPPLVALLIPLASARLLRLLLPGRWWAAVTIVVAQALLLGDGAASHADFALLRLQQGKALLLHVVLPLIAAYAIEFALAPSRARWLRLAAAQVAAVGLSSSGLWLAPVAAGLGLVSGLPALRGDTVLRPAAARLALGLTASIHPLALALALRAETARAFRDALHPLESLRWPGERLVGHALEVVFGSGAVADLALFSLLAALLAGCTPLLRRFAAVHGVALLLLLWNPLVAPFVAANVAGADTYFRVFWTLPMPVLIAAVLTAPLEWPARAEAGGRRALERGAWLLAAVALLAVVAEVHTLSPANGTRLGPPGDELPAPEREAALALVAHAGPGERVLAPLRVARWVPLFHQHPAPLVVREMYLDVLHDRLGAAELDRRSRLAHLVGGTLRLADGGTLLARAIEDYPLAAVCLGDAALARPELRRALGASGLEVRHRDAHFEVWARPPR